jgi:hypothetical protein
MLQIKHIINKYLFKPEPICPAALWVNTQQSVTAALWVNTQQSVTAALWVNTLQSVTDRLCLELDKLMFFW